MEYDLIVVGAGPGGSTTANTAAQKGLKVLMLDKRQAIGEPVRCAEGIGAEVKEHFELPDRVIANKITSSQVMSPCGNIASNSGDGYILERIASDKFLAERAIENGATLITRARAVGARVSQGLVDLQVITPEGTKHFTTPLVIGADGRESNVAKWFGIDTSIPLSEIDKGFQYDMITPIKDAHTIKMYLGRNVAPRGYAWIFPKSENRANIGLCVPGDTPKTAKELLDQFLISHHLRGSIIRAVCSTIPMMSARHEICGEHFMLVGDAARFVNPIHGGGMEPAMFSGEIAGTLAGDASPLKYKEKTRSLTENNKKVQKINTVFKELSDENLDFLIGNMTGQDLLESTSGVSLSSIISIFKKQPSLIKFLPKLL